MVNADVDTLTQIVQAVGKGAGVAGLLEQAIAEQYSVPNVEHAIAT